MVNSSTSPAPAAVSLPATQPPAASIPLAQATLEVQLAVELILLMEQQQLPPETVLAALDIVKADFLRQANKAAASLAE
jgi:hypothetical protein